MEFRHDNPEFFTGDANFSWKVGYDDWTTGRFITCTSSDGKSFVVAGNFDSQARRIYVAVPSAGTWTDYRNPSKSYTVSSQDERIAVELGQGEYILMTNFNYSVDNEQ